MAIDFATQEQVKRAISSFDHFEKGIRDLVGVFCSSGHREWRHLLLPFREPGDPWTLISGTGLTSKRAFAPARPGTGRMKMAASANAEAAIEYPVVRVRK
jgi:hypothetical protein